MLALNEISAVLACSKAAASQIRGGSYPAQDGRLAGQYAALVAVVAAAEARGRESAVGRICYDCPRDDCAGCRVAEISDA